MIALSPNSLLSDANREVQAADHVLSAVYPLTRDPKALVSVMAHEMRALNSAVQAIAVSRGAEHVDAQHAFAFATHVAHAKDAKAVHERLTRVLSDHESAPVVFTRGNARVIATSEFADLTTVDVSSVTHDLAVTKSFVHEAHAHIALGR